MKNGRKVFWAAMLVALGSPLFAAGNPPSNGPINGTQNRQTVDSSANGISKRVRHELLMLPYFTIFDNFSYRVDGDTVTLLGQVTRPVLREDAQRAVQRVEGVSKVENNIEVLPLSPFDNQIRWATARAIYGFATLNRYALGTHPSIHIIVKNGNVTLVGVVDNKGDKNIAGIRANSVPGVFSVENDLQVVS
jgi:osmotically-inducible protein OsmY